MAIETKREGLRRAQFGLFEADLEAEELRRSGVRVRLQSQPFRLLASLLQHSGEVVARETLQQELWGANTTVDFDHSLGIAVNKLREALGDSAENPRFIETLARRGYRFIAPVKVLDPLPAEPPVATVIAPPPAYSAAATVTSPAAAASASAVTGPGPVRHLTGSLWIVGAMGLLCLVLVLALILRPPTRAPYHVAQITFSGHVLINDPDVESFSSSASDGTRIYFSDMNNGSPALAVALTANGEMSHFNLPSEIGAPLIGSLSPDGSQLAVRSHLQAEPEQPLWIVPTLGGDARRVGNVLAHDVTWMPDGQHLLVASGNQLVEIGTDGMNPSPLLTTPGRAFWLRWSPDGTHLRFTLRNPNRQTSELWEVNADGSHLHPLLPGWSQPSSECCGSWTPNGDDYVFQSSHSGHSEIWMLREKPWYRAGGGPRQITNGPLEYEGPTTVSSGDRMYFIGATTQFDLLRVTPGFTGFVTLDENLSAAAMAEYSPDSKWVAWINEADNSLWRSRVDGTERIELTTSPLRIFNMRWSPDDHSLAVMAEEPGRPWKIYLIDAEGGKITPVLNEDRNEADPTWSPDGHSIVFGRLPDRMDSSQPKAIYLLDLTTKKVIEIPGSTGLFSPRLSPDGRYLLAMPLEQHALLLFDRTTGRWNTLATHGAADPTWSHDGRYVYFQDFLEADKPIYRVSVPDGKLEKIATLDNLRPTAATDYRLIGLAPGDLPMVTARTPAVNLYKVDLRER